MDTPDPITQQLQSLHRQLADLDGGELADYIPELSNADPNRFGIALVSVRGHTYRAGDAETLFTIQSVSKPFAYALALGDIGMEAMLKRVDVEPSGEAFNAISLEPETGRPANPMINAGAILVTSTIEARNAEERFNRMLTTLSAFAGRQLDVDEAVYQSERDTGDRNRALAYLMRNAGVLEGDAEEAVDVYFRQCAIRVSSVDLATMAATLANRGVNPVTGVTVVDANVASNVLTVMATCGMYNYSGNWLLSVGLPAKSGVSGALLAASPNEFGIGTYSPLVDARGNSVRGVKTCKQLAAKFDLGLLQRAGAPVPALYSIDISELAFRSTGWNEGHPRSEISDDIIIRGLQGDICFADAESLLQSLADLMTAGTAPKTAVLELHRVGAVSRAASGILSETVRTLGERGHSVVVIDSENRMIIEGVHRATGLDDALVWARSQSS